MPEPNQRETATDPEALGRMFLIRANAGDVDGVVALYEPTAVIESPPGQTSTGSAAIRRLYERLLANRPQFSGEVRQVLLRHGDLALTSTRFHGGATAEVARRQADGTWLWILDQPNVVG
ncbi:YybH family protein [Rathayibacter sp. KR2-224]|uniref:YybH family protein n=1 Tax=Rathayibacter sp. KR2-224 TaxID=3400913 RepID=UPI003C0A5151